MKNIMIGKDNINCIMDFSKDRTVIDQEFLEALWQYVLYSRNISRIAPECKICSSQGNHGDFTFEGFGGIKKVGNGVVYIPISKDELYIIPDAVYHYFYVHNIVPVLEFRNAVVYGVKPDNMQYIEIVKSIYVPENQLDNSWEHIKCDCCGNSFNGCIAYRIGDKKRNVKVYQASKRKKMFHKDKYIGVCFECMHYTKV